MKLKMLLCLAIAVIAMPAFSQGLKAFKLKNGLSVYIWEDASKSDVFGLVGVRAGSINEPEEYTGLAHYLGTSCTREQTISVPSTGRKKSLSTRKSSLSMTNGLPRPIR